MVGNIIAAVLLVAFLGFLYYGYRKLYDREFNQVFRELEFYIQEKQVKVCMVTDFVLGGQLFGIFSNRAVAEATVKAYCGSKENISSSYNDFAFKIVVVDVIEPAYK